jgi:lysophospholipase L1-like esterase
LIRFVFVVVLTFPTIMSGAEPEWVAPMKQVHAHFTGTPGTLANFGDSITVTMAYWAPLRFGSKTWPKELGEALDVVRGHMKDDCWAGWKGPKFGSEGGMTIRWARDNVERWLKDHNPETAVIMFGTNDLGQMKVDEFEAKTGEVVERCLKNGTVVILTTLPPRSGMLDKSTKFAEAVRRVAKAKRVPLIDYQVEVLKRRPDDWDGSAAKFKGTPGGVYDVPTLISGDGVHPSNPKGTGDYSEEHLRQNGYALRNYLTILAYADVIKRVLK